MVCTVSQLPWLSSYRVPCLQAIHSCAIKFPDVAASVVQILMDFLGDSNVASALDVIFFVREIMETNPKLRGQVLPLPASPCQQVSVSSLQARAGQGCSLSSPGSPAAGAFCLGGG